MYNLCLFHYDRISDLTKEPSLDEINEIMSLEPEYLHELETVILPYSQGESAVKKALKDSMRKDLIIIDNLLPSNFNHNLFTLQNLENMFCQQGMNYKIDVVEQNPKFWGFSRNKYK